jgi:hypothetical protein
MKKLLTLIALCFGITSFACDNYIPNHKVCVSLEWVDGPFINARGQRAFSSARVTVTNLDGEARPFDGLQVYPWMIMSGGHQHGARPVVINSEADGVYKVSEILMNEMMGVWQMRVALKPEGTFDPSNDFDLAFTIWSSN